MSRRRRLPAGSSSPGFPVPEVRQCRYAVGYPDRHALRGLDTGVRGPVRPPAASDPQGRGRSLGDLARSRSSMRSAPRSSACSSVDLESATEFLLIAATLVELKARRLLPGRDDIELDEELSRFEERDLLLARLLDCKTFQDAAKVLQPQLTGPTAASPRTAGPEEPFRSMAPDPLERVSPRRPAQPPAPGPVPGAARRGGRHRPHRADPGQRARRGRDDARAAAATGADALPRPHVGAPRTGSRSSCASSRCSSCTSRG